MPQDEPGVIGDPKVLRLHGGIILILLHVKCFEINML